MPAFTTDRQAQLARPRDKPWRASFGGGLLLEIRPSGAKTWVIRYQLEGKRRDQGLGSYPEVGLAEAREKARKAKSLLTDKIDPITFRDEGRAERRAQNAAAAKVAAQTERTFRTVAETLLANQESGWSSPKTAASWRLTLDKWAYPAIGDVPIAEVGQEHVIKALEPVWAAKPATGKKLQRRISAVLDFAAARKWRPADNPAAGRVLRLTRALPAVAATGRRWPSLPWHRVPLFLRALDRQEGVSPLALRFAILTCVRSNEVRQARWSEIDVAAGIWAIPGHRMKGGKTKDTPAHRVPLADAMRDALARALAWQTNDEPPPLSKLAAHVALRGDALIFPNGRGDALSDATLGACIKRLNEGRAEGRPMPWIDVDGRSVTAHGFRRSFREWVDDTMPEEAAAAEKALAHDEPNKVSAAYRGSDLLPRRRTLMEAWNSFCTGTAAADQAQHLEMESTAP